MDVNGEFVEALSWQGATSIPVFGEVVVRKRFLMDSDTRFDHEDRDMMGVVEAVK